MAVVLAALAAAYVTLSGWREEARVRAAAAERSDRMTDAAWEAWRAAALDDLRGLDGALAALEGLRSAPAGVDAEAWRRDHERRTRWLSWVRQVLVWQQRRWDDVRPVEPPRAHPPTPRPKNVEGVRLLCERLASRPEVAGSVLGRRVAEACGLDPEAPAGRPPSRPMTTDRFWTLLLEHARSGGDARAIEAAGAEWQDFCRESGECREAAGVAIFRSAVWAQARRAALERGDTILADRVASRIVPFMLSRPPFGPVEGKAPVPRLERQRDGSWVAFDPATGRRLWHSARLSENTQALWVPVADGSVIVLAGAQLARLSGATGRVIARLPLEDTVWAAWPDPRDPFRLVALTAAYRSEPVLREVGIQDGRTDPPVRLGSAHGGAPPLSPDALFGEAAAWLGLVAPGAGRRERDQAARAAQKDARGRAFVVERLRLAAERDPENPESWLALVETLGREGPPELVSEAAEQVVAATRGAPLRVAVRVGTRLDLAGRHAEADQLYDVAARRFLDLHGNPDLSFVVNPAYELRRIGGKLFAQGDVGRATALVEVGRRFSTYVAGDTKFYRRYVLWLRGQGREDEARRIEPRIAGSEDVGGAGILSDRFFVGLDVALALFWLGPPVLLLLLARSWLRSRATRNADLCGRGWRTAGQRLAAFFIHPLERVRFTFLAYALRGERTLVVLLGGLLLYDSCVLAGGLATVERLFGQPPEMADGFLADDAVMEAFAQQTRSGRETPSLPRLLAESHRARGERGAAEAALSRALALRHDDPLALNNAAVLAEEEGRLGEARAAYGRAARLGDESSAVARFNLARLAGEASAIATTVGELPHRDRLRADHLGTGAPLWALCPGRDLLDTLIEGRTLASAARAGFVDILSNPPGRALRTATNVPQLPVVRALEALDVVAYGSGLLVLLALVWLPLPVRPVAATREASGRRPPLERWGRRLALVLGTAVPGAFDLLAGSPAAGALIALGFVLALTVALIVSQGGAIAALTHTHFGGGYFAGVEADVAFPGLAGLGPAALALAVVVFAVNLVVMVRRWRGERAGLRTPEA